MMAPGTNKSFESAKTTVGSECNSKERITHKRRRARGATRCPTDICPLAPPRIANTSAVGRPSRRRRFVANAMEFMLFSRSPIPGYGFIPGTARRWAREREESRWRAARSVVDRVRARLARFDEGTIANRSVGRSDNRNPPFPTPDRVPSHDSKSRRRHGGAAIRRKYLFLANKTPRGTISVMK